MKKMLCILLILAATPCHGADDVLRVRGDHNYPPFEHLDENGKPAGYNVDIMRAVARVMGLKVEITLDRWSVVREEIEKGKADVVLGMYKTEARDDLVDFSTAHYLASYALFVRDGSDIKSIEDARGRHIVVQRDDLGCDYVLENAISGWVAMVDSPEDALRQLAAGKQDCALVPRLQSMLILERESLTGIESVGPPILQREYCFAVTEGNRRLLAKLNEGLKIIEATGEYARINREWFGVHQQDIRLQDLLKYSLWAGVLLVAMVLISLIWSWSLRRRVALRTRQLVQSREDLRITLDSIGDAVIATDIEGHVKRMNPTAEQLTGWDAAEAKGQPLSEVFHIVNAQTGEGGSNPVEEVMKTGKVVGLANHTVLIAKDGTERQIADSASPIRGEDGVMTGVVLVFRDVTVEYHMRQRLRDTLRSLQVSEQQRRDAQTMARLGHWHWNVKTGEVDWSEEVYGVFGLDPETFTPTIDSIMALSPWPEDHQRDQELIDRAMKHRTQGSYEQRFLRPDGSTGYYASTFEGVYDESDQLVAIKGVVQDITERKQAEKIVRLSQALIEGSKDSAVWARMDDGRILYANDAACETFGYTHEEMLNLGIPDLDLEWTTGAFIRKAVELRRAGRVRFASRHRRKDGTVFPVEITANVVEVEGEEYIIAFAADITEQRRQEERLQASEQRFRELFNNMASGVAVYEAVDDGADFVFVDFNRAGERIESVSRDRIIGRRVTEVFPGVEAFGLLDVLRRVWRSGKPEEYPVTLYFDQRIEGWRENFVYRLPSGEVVAVYDDVSERVRAEEERDRLFNHSIDMLCVAGFDGRFKQVNPAFTKVLGWSEEELLAKQWLEFVHPDDVDATLAMGEKLIGGNAIHAFENRYRCKDGTYRWLSWNSFPLVGQGQIFAVCRDVTGQKEAAETLRQSEERYRLAQRLSGVGTWEWNVLTNEVFWSDEVIPMWGYTREGFRGIFEEVSQRIHPDDYDRWQENVRRCVEEGAEHDLEFRIVWPDGSVHWVAGSGDAERDAEGKAIRVIGVVADITERKQADEALRESERQYREIFDSSRDGFVIVGLDGHIIDANRAYCKMVGYSLDELQELGGGFYTITPERWRKWEAEEIIEKRLLALGYSGLYKKEYIHKDGHVFPIELQTYARMGDDGKPEYLWGIVRDVTEREEAEESLRKSERRYREVFEGSRDGIVIVKPEGPILDANQAYCDMLGYTLDELKAKGEGYYEITPERWRKWEKEEIIDKYMYTRGYSGLYTKEYIHKDGHTFPVELHVYSQKNEEGKTQYLCGIVRDITEREEAEKSLRESERSKAVLLSNLPGMSYRCKFDKDWTMEFVSPGCKELTGWEVDDLLNNRTLSFNDLIAGKYQETMWGMWQEAVREHRRVQDEYEIITRDGTRKWVWEQGMPIYDDEGNVVALEGLILDITDRKKAEQELASTTAFLDAIVNESPFSMWVARPDGTLVRTNRAVREALNLVDDQIINQYNVLEDENILKQGKGEAVRAVFEEGKPARFNLDWRAAEVGDIEFEQAYDLHIDIAMFPILDAAGQVAHVVGQWVDITDRRKAEQELEATTAFLDTIVNESPYAMWVAEPNGDIIRTNRALREILGVTDEQLIGHYNVLKDDNLREQGIDEAVRRVFDEAVPARFSVEWRAEAAGDASLKDARRLHLDAAMFPIKDAKGTLTHVVCQWVDITDRVRAEEAVKNSEWLLHEIIQGTPVAAFVIGDDHKVLHWNQALEGLSGISSEQVIGTTDQWRAFYPEARPCFADVVLDQDFEALERYYGGKYSDSTLIPEAYEATDFFPTMGEDGRWLTFTVALIRDAEGRPVGAVEMLVDVTERVRAEEAVKDSERLLNDILQGTPVAAFVIGEDHKVLRWNRALAQLSRITEEEVLGTTDQWRAFYPEARPCLADVILDQDFEVLERYYGGKYRDSALIPEAYEATDFFPAMGEDGRWLTFTVALIRDAEGRPVGAVEMLVDVTERMRAVAALQESEDKHRTLFETMSQGVLYRDVEGRVTDANPAALKILGVTFEELVERGNYDTRWQSIREDGSRLPGDEHPSIKALKSGRSIQNEVMGIYNGETDAHRWLNVNAVPRFRPGEDKPYQVYTTLEDVTERRREEQVTAAQLRLIEFAAGHSTTELLQHFLDEAELLTGSKAGFYHFLGDDQETLSLQAWSTNTLSGMCTAEGAGMHYPISKAGVWVDAIRQRRPVVHNDYQSLPHKKGLPPGHAPIIRELVVPVSRGDKIVAILGVGNKHIDYNQGDVKILQQLADLAWEIVVRKQAEEKLRESEARFRVIFEQASVGVAVIETTTGRYTRINQRYADILGYSQEDVQALRFQDITHPDDLAEDEVSRDRMIRGEITEFSREKRYFRKDGSIVWVNLFVSAMWNPGEEPNYNIAVVEDITKRKHAEEELTQYRQHLEELVDARTQELEAAHVELIRRERLATLGRLTATVSHELRNPLGTIRGSLFTINRATQDHELGIERALTRAQRNIDRCDGIISELLDYTRSTVPETEPTNLDTWITEILDEQTIPEGITLDRSLQVNRELPLDREKFRRCVVNLVTNACQAIEEIEPCDGRVTIESECKDDRIEVRVLDTGPGIEPDLLEKIFEPLYSTKGFGVGLGLSIVKQLIEAGGGGISITSTLGAGTQATLWLPSGGMQGEAKETKNSRS